MAFRIFNPRVPLDFASRNRLLQAALRPEPAPYAIEREYPIVLSESNGRFSYCMGAGEEVVAHANLWPRVMTGSGREIRVGLVGNVATDARVRGQGLMSQMLDELKKIADEQDLKALVLWSDLLEFYQKQGFQSFGEERRYRLKAESLGSLGVRPKGFSRAKVSSLDEETAKMLLQRRLPVTTTLVRSAEEFKALLEIPGLDAFLRRQPGGAIDGYALLGKGIDMIGVIHEWGVETPEALLEAAACASHSTGFGEILVLAPAGLDASWHETLAKHASEVTSHGMALMWVKDEPGVASMLSKSFIWGLDSI